MPHMTADDAAACPNMPDVVPQQRLLPRSNPDVGLLLDAGPNEEKHEDTLPDNTAMSTPSTMSNMSGWIEVDNIPQVGPQASASPVPRHTPPQRGQFGWNLPGGTTWAPTLRPQQRIRLRENTEDMQIYYEYFNNQTGRWCEGAWTWQGQTASHTTSQQAHTPGAGGPTSAGHAARQCRQPSHNWDGWKSPETAPHV